MDFSLEIGIGEVRNVRAAGDALDQTRKLRIELPIAESLGHPSEVAAAGRYTASNEQSAMSSLTLEIPEDAALTLKVPPEGLGQVLLLAAAAKLYEIGSLSSGAAARLAGVPRTALLSRLADFGVDTFSLIGEELDRETRLG